MGKGSGGGSGSKGGGSSSSGGSGSKGGSTGSSQAAADNRSNQMNPNNSAYYSSRAHGYDKYKKSGEAKGHRCQVSEGMPVWL
ncbi:hypothetical protein PC116_g27581 [Phytophthora cactorum]|nr:hypothetical protein PC112_g23268 [Phytophthora cactorum]KAG3067371.1 hypothetical protein PI125_g23656 [Phytophthora idaei]KAG3124205.1 hypothetical protein PC128_g27511 [Phytophthora cactorum]KAG3127893.1 hypothetical protein PI126_g21654 [Phytophthora idaei]KAG3233121.1 hypothetical protein PI124_g21799 [Phytophthora idaei]